MNQQRDLQGISALVTGASSSVGKAAAKSCDQPGAEVVVHGRDTARGSAVADAITAAGGKARFVAADLSARPSWMTWSTRREQRGPLPPSLPAGPPRGPPWTLANSRTADAG